MSPVRILIADDHALLRAGIRALLENIPQVEVVAEAANGQEALAAVAAQRPDLILTDIAMPVMNGLELVAHLSREYPDIKTIILSMHSNEEYVCKALQSGAVGYLLKDSGTAELSLAIQAIARGESYLSPGVSKHVIADYIRRTTSGSEPRPPELLTPRQREILRLIALGQTTKAIARTLGISVKTVETHRAQLMERLDIYDVAGLVRYAIRIGLAKLDE
jgi:DNA-binding NarL/FixJ family response regulator